MEDMDKNGGLSEREKQRQAAAEIMRQRAINAYETGSATGIYTGESGAIKSVFSTTLKAEPKKAEVSAEQWKKYHSAWQNYYQKYYSEYYSNAAKEYVAKYKEKAEISLQGANMGQGSAEESSEKVGLSGGVREGASGASGSFSGAHGSAEQSSEKFAQQASSAKVGLEKEGIFSPEEPTAVEKTLRERIREKASDQAQKRSRATARRRKLTPVFAGLAVVIAVLFLQYNRLIFAPIAAYVSPGESPASEIEAVDPVVSGGKVSAEDKLLIPKINVDVPVAFNISLDQVNEAMKYGVAHYVIKGASASPGEIGNTVITGHSAGDVYNNDAYKYIFSGLERLEVGDLIYVNYKSTRYTYRVTKFQTVEPTNVAALVYETNKPMLTLITCTPLGTSRYRLLVTAEQISPSYENAPTAAPAIASEDDTEATDLPANEKTFFERIWAWLTGGD